MDITKHVELFKKFDYETKRAKVVDMLKQLQWTHDTFALFYSTVRTLSTIPENILIYLYQSILEIAEEIELGKKEESQEKIKKMAEVITIVKKQETMEKEQEGNPEDMLKNM